MLSDSRLVIENAADRGFADPRVRCNIRESRTHAGKASIGELHPSYFTDPAVRPLTMYFWSTKKRTTTGSAASTAPAAKTGQFAEVS